MARLINRLTADEIAKMGPGMYADGGNLWIKVTSGANDTTNKSWVFRYHKLESVEQRQQRKAEGKRQKERQAGLGPYPQISFGEARKRAEQMRLLLARRIDPLDATKNAYRARIFARRLNATALARAQREHRPTELYRHFDAMAACSMSEFRFVQLGACASTKRHLTGSTKLLVLILRYSLVAKRLLLQNVVR
jgi:hypothetical protein